MTLRVSKLTSLACVLLLAACGGSANGDDETSTSADDTSPETGTDSSDTGPTTDTSGGDGDGADTSGDGDSTTNGDGDGTTTGGDGDGDSDVPPCPYDEVSGDPNMTWEYVAGGFDRPVGVTAHRTIPDRLYVIEQHAGNIRYVNGGETSATGTVMNISVNSSQNELGLLGFEFHPDFPEDPRFYVNYNPPGAYRTRISEFTMNAEGTMADPASERILMEIDQPYWNHDGGGLKFGPDGYLYIGLGDGGSGGDPMGNGQNTNTLLGKLLRIDVEPSGNLEYTIPSDNPFVGMGGYREEIWAYGLRNPWRFSFDTDGTLYLGDVGQDAYEEIDIISGGGNYGWNEMEGFHCFQSNCDDSSSTPNGTNQDGMVLPIIEHQHNSVDSICGGHVYRSCQVPGWQGRYIYGDLNSTVFSLEWDGSAVSNAGSWGNAPNAILSFGDNAWGDVYVTDFGGSIHRLAPQ